MKPDFDRAQDAATALLLRQDLHTLHIDVRDFHLPPNIIIDSFQNYYDFTGTPISNLNTKSLEGACTIGRGKERLILYDDSISYEPRKHWGIAHELGHVYLGHTVDNREAEIEAHFFAAQLVAPEIVLLNMAKRQGHLYGYELPEHFNISGEAAEKRVSCLKKRCGYNYGVNDRLLEERFAPILDKELYIPRFSLPEPLAMCQDPAMHPVLHPELW